MPHKRSTRKEIKRLDGKSERAATKRALEGGHSRQPTTMNWSSPSRPMLVDDEVPSTGKRRKQGCPKNKGGDHAPVFKNIRGKHYMTVCDFCGKHRWGRSTKGWGATPRPPSPTQTLYYSVYTTNGSFVNRYWTRQAAIDACTEKNEDAQILDIDVRYVARYRDDATIY